MHVVDAIAERFVELLLDATDAQDRITRDLPKTEVFQAREDLPAIDIRIGAEEEFTPRLQAIHRATVVVNVDLYAADSQNVSSALLELRRQAYNAIMAGTWPSGCIRVLPGVASEVARDSEGSIPIAAQRTPFLVLYQHSLTDSTQP